MKTVNIPVFNPVFHVEILENEGIFLISETDQFVLSGKIYSLIAPYINGKNSVDNIIDLLMEEHKAHMMLAEAYYAFQILANMNYILEAEEVYPTNSAYWHLIKPELRVSTESKNPHTVSIKSFSNIKTVKRDFIKLLSSQEISVTEGESDLLVVFADDYLDPRLSEINKDALSKKKPWLLIKPVGKILWIGPLFTPFNTGCLDCLTQRIKSNREVETFIKGKVKKKNKFYASRGSLQTTVNTGLNLAVTEISKWFIGNKQNLLIDGKVITFDTGNLEIEKHNLIKRPQCKECGTEEYKNPTATPIVLKSVKKSNVNDGGHRAVIPEKTFEIFRQHISPITGIVNQLSRITDPSSLIHSYHAGHNTAISYDNVFLLKKGLRSKAGGKGRTDIQAKVSGLCEAIERYSGLYQGMEYRITASYRELGNKAIHPNECMLFSDEQFKKREEWNKFAGSFHSIPDPLAEEKKIEWTPVYSLRNNEFKYLPTSYCYYSYSKDRKDFYSWADSNGNASGNSIEEAILQGFFELIERDSVCLWWYNRVKRPVVDLESFDEPYFKTIKDYYKTLHRDIWVIDITSDFGIPAFAAITRRTDKVVEDILLGFGCHFDAKIAIMRALTEVNQFMPAVMNITNENTEYTFDDRDVLHWWKTATLENQPYLAPDKNMPLKKQKDYTYEYSDDLLEDVQFIIDLVHSKGHEIFVLNQTRPDINMPVVKVIIPGIRHFWARFASGRLYDVPVKLGWLNKPLKEKELNPIPMFI